MTNSMANADPVLVIGGGLAGLTAALALAPRKVILLTAAKIGEAASSPWAQGGIASAVGPDDSTQSHAVDTLAAGDGLCDPNAVTRITAAGPATIQTLRDYGVAFDLDSNGNLALGLEAAHSHRRIVHAGGDASGLEVIRALGVRVAASPHVELRVNHIARRILTRNGEVTGLVVDAPYGQIIIPSHQIIIASGGVGGLYLSTTNPLTSTGSGLALAARAGAVMADMEFVQFHPTALAVGLDPMPLISEAVRGEGAVLLDETGCRFMLDVPGHELAPRDVVSRNVWRQIIAGHQIFLDARTCLGERFKTRFPAITELCQSSGIDPATQPIPIRPAAHYHMGGIAADEHGRTSLPGLWAIGEAACTGLHGANRLASNSLLEAAVTGLAAAQDIQQLPPPTRLPVLIESAPAAQPAEPIRAIMEQYVGVLRDEAGLTTAVEQLSALAADEATQSDPALVGWMIAASALARQESRGAQARTDFPAHAPGPAQRHLLRLEDMQLHFLPPTSVQARGA